MTSVRSRQRRALAAGGMVLGFGAVLVAASWTDNVLGFANFQSGSGFGIQSSVNNGGTWTSNPVSGATNVLSFAPTVGAVVPGFVSYASIQLRTDKGSSAAGIALNGATLAGDAALGGALRYRTVKVATLATPCDAAAFGAPSSTWIVGSSGAAPLTTSSGPAVFTLPAATPTVEGAASKVCFEISLPPIPANWTNAALQNKQSKPDWAFVGTS
nr:hypothetical protein [Rhodococcus sp. 06-621-2]